MKKIAIPREEVEERPEPAARTHRHVADDEIRGCPAESGQIVGGATGMSIPERERAQVVSPPGTGQLLAINVRLEITSGAGARCVGGREEQHRSLLRRGPLIERDVILLLRLARGRIGPWTRVLRISGRGK